MTDAEKTAELRETLTLGDYKVRVVEAQSGVVAAARYWVKNTSGADISGVIESVMHLERMEADLKEYIESIRKEPGIVHD